MINLRRIAQNFVSVTAVRGLSGILSFLLFSYIARKIGVEGLGEFSTLVAFFLLLRQMPLLGLHVPISRDVAAFPERTNALAADGFIVSIVPSIFLCCTIGLIGRLMYPGHMEVAFWMVGFSILPTAVTSVCESVLTGQERITQVAVVDFFETFLRSIAIAVNIAVGADMATIFGFFLAFRFMAAIIYLWPLQFSKIISLKNVSKCGILGMAREIPTFLAILLFAAAINRVGVIVLSKMGSIQEVGYFSPPQKLCEILLMIMSLATFVCFPALSKFFESDRKEFRRFVGITMICFSLLLFPPLAILAAHGDKILIGLFGAHFASADHLLEILIFGLGLQALDKILSASMLAAKKQRQDLIILTTVFVLFMVLTFLLIPILGALGLAYSVTISAVVQFILRLYFSRQMLGGRYLISIIGGPILAALGMYSLLVYFEDAGWSPLMGMVVSLFIFCVLTLTTSYKVFIPKK